MSIDIGPLGATPPPPGAPAPANAGRTPGRTPTSESSDPVTVDMIPLHLPQEVHDAIGAAASAYDRLAEKGQTLHFHIDEAKGRLIVEVHDLRGNLLSTVPPSKALEVAAGGSLD